MKTNISNAQKEVWECKDSLYEELKNIPKTERLKYIRNKNKEIINRIRNTKSHVA